MKKTAVFLLCGLACLSLAGCGSQASSDQATATVSAGQESASTDEVEIIEEDSNDDLSSEEEVTEDPNEAAQTEEADADDYDTAEDSDEGDYSATYYAASVGSNYSDEANRDDGLPYVYEASLSGGTLTVTGQLEQSSEEIGSYGDNDLTAEQSFSFPISSSAYLSDGSGSISQEEFASLLSSSVENNLCLALDFKVENGQIVEATISS